MERVFVDGIEDAGLPATDPGFTRGLNVFETMRTYAGVVFRMEAHLTRLEASARAMGITSCDLDLVATEIDAVAKGEVVIRCSLTAGGHRVLYVAPLDPSRIGRPVTLASVQMTPSPWLPGSVKHGSRAGWVLASRRLGVDEVVFCDTAGHMLEANRSNIFVIEEGVLKTPPLDGQALEGVTRGALLEAAAAIDMPVEVCPVPLSGSYDEFYVSSTLKELAPVAQLDERAMGGGPMGERLLHAFRALVAKECALE